MNIFELYQNQDYGAILRISSSNIADDFDDFLTEDCYVFYNLKDEDNIVEFFFGQASSIEKVQKLIDIYIKKNKNGK